MRLGQGRGGQGQRGKKGSHPLRSCFAVQPEAFVTRTLPASCAPRGRWYSDRKEVRSWQDATREGARNVSRAAQKHQQQEQQQ